MKWCVCVFVSVSHSMYHNAAILKDILTFTVKASSTNKIQPSSLDPANHDPFCVFHPEVNVKESVAHVVNGFCSY